MIHDKLDERITRKYSCKNQLNISKPYIAPLNEHKSFLLHFQFNAFHEKSRLFVSITQLEFALKGEQNSK